MELTKLNELKKLLEQGAKFKNFWSNYRRDTAPKYVDKHSASFVTHSVGTFNFSLTDVVFYSCKGEYGSSSVDTYGKFDGPLAKAYFVRALNAMSEELFQKAGEFMLEDSKRLKVLAEKELLENQTLLKSLENN